MLCAPLRSLFASAAPMALVLICIWLAHGGKNCALRMDGKIGTVTLASIACPTSARCPPPPPPPPPCWWREASWVGDTSACLFPKLKSHYLSISLPSLTTRLLVSVSFSSGLGFLKRFHVKTSVMSRKLCFSFPGFLVIKHHRPWLDWLPVSSSIPSLFSSLHPSHNSLVTVISSFDLKLAVLCPYIAMSFPESHACAFFVLFFPQGWHWALRIKERNRRNRKLTKYVEINVKQDRNANINLIVEKSKSSISTRRNSSR